jgi:D-hydroxyproline dehydrogenase subunit beta
MSAARSEVIVVGAGIVGLAHAYAAAQRGLRVTVVERDHRCVGASIRNFGFITVTGQPAGATWQRARVSRDHWDAICPQAGIEIVHRGLWVLGCRPAARDVLEAFMATEMAAGNELHGAGVAAARMPALRTGGASAAMYSPHELRVESRSALPRLAAWLAERHGVEFVFGEAVLEIDTPRVRTAARTLHAERVVVCPGADLQSVARPWFARHALQLTRLQMLRIRPRPALALHAAVMSDLSLVRYGGYAALPAAQALHRQLQDEVPHSLAHGIHLIAVQSADGTLVVGDSHHSDRTPEPFASQAVDGLILQHLREALRIDAWDVLERWTGVYPTGVPQDCLIEAPDAATRAVVVTSGTGASTAFGIAEEVFNGW